MKKRAKMAFLNMQIISFITHEMQIQEVAHLYEKESQNGFLEYTNNIFYYYKKQYNVPSTTKSLQIV
jgi:hypothetical protein